MTLVKTWIKNLQYSVGLVLEYSTRTVHRVWSNETYVPEATWTSIRYQWLSNPQVHTNQYKNFPRLNYLGLLPSQHCAGDKYSLRPKACFAVSYCTVEYSTVGTILMRGFSDDSFHHNQSHSVQLHTSVLNGVLEHPELLVCLFLPFILALSYLLFLL